MFGPVSGAHFNPVVSLVITWKRQLLPRDCGFYIAAELSGGLAGMAVAHAMFGLPLLQISKHIRPTAGEALGEFIGTFGLVLVVLLVSRFRREAIPIAVALFITSAYWFTSSTSFANPAVTLARSVTDTFAGISPESVPLFIAGQVVGGTVATVFASWILRKS
jgi:glycerol uptake facilitator-like aquaporin